MIPPLPTLPILVALLAGPAPDRFPFARPVEPPRRVEVIAHRGAMRQAPEDTAAAIERSIGDGVDWAEVDVRLTRDGRHVLLHDADLARATDVEGPVADRTLDEIGRLDAGSKFARRFAGARIPTLVEALRLSKGRINLGLDCKHVDPPRLVAEVLDAGMERQVVISGPLDVLRAVRDSPGGGRVALMPEWRPGVDLDGLRPDAVELDAAELTPGRSRSFHDRGIVVQARMLGDSDRPDAWDRAIEAGADRLRTDRPEEVLAREVLRKARPDRVKLAHHRGASRYAPENTLPAFEKAIRLGADFVEFDIRTARDGRPFLLHDATVDRTTDARGPLRERDSSEVARLDAGSWFGRPFAGTPLPTLDAFLGAVAGRVDLYVDAKDIPPEALVAALRDRALIDRAVVYQGPGYLARLRSIEPRLRRMPPLGRPDDVDALADRLAPYAFDTRWSILSKPLIDRCHARGIQVFSDALGPNETIDSYRRAIDAGIDLIQTDHPLRVLRAIELQGTAAR